MDWDSVKRGLLRLFGWRGSALVIGMQTRYSFGVQLLAVHIVAFRCSFHYHFED